MMIYRFPGSSALRASTPGLKDDDPSGAPPLRDRQAALHPDRGARSIGIGHPRSGDRCTASHPSDLSDPSDPSDLSDPSDPSDLSHPSDLSDLSDLSHPFDKTAPSFDERFY